MKDFPALVPQELQLEGQGYLEAAADITLSSAGKHAALESSGQLPTASCASAVSCSSECYALAADMSPDC